MERRSSDESLRQRQRARFRRLFPGCLERLDWSADRIGEFRQHALRRLLAVAMARSPWHRGRLAGIDPRTFSEADLHHLPVMTKAELLDHFDDIVADRRLSRDRCERHLEARAGSYLLDRYQVLASGGSSGRRGIFVYGWDAWSLCWASLVRFQLRDWTTDPALTDVPRITAVLGAARPTHFSSAIGRTFSTPEAPRMVFAVGSPIDEIVAGLNRLQPTILTGYSSFLPQLAHHARAGRLRIAPRRVIGISEPLLPEAKQVLRETWRVPVGTAYGMTEGLFAGFCGRATHLPDDFVLVEPVDEHARPVPEGSRATSLVITNLYNHDLPLIRYEVPDEITVLVGRCECGSAMRRIADPQGRLDDTFHYPGGHHVHPHVFRSVLAGHRSIVEYQVHQTRHGADVRILTEEPVDTQAIERELSHQLSVTGLSHPEVAVAPVPALDRLPTGKLQRFVPLPS
jgi:phenylacetate-CoA ligase